jgi:hypothetical protein
MKVRSKIELIIVALLISSSCYAADVAQNAVADGSGTVTGTDYLNGYSGATSQRYTVNSILAIVPTASETVIGKVELSTDAEAVTGTSDAVVVTPGNLTARLAAPGTIGGGTPGAVNGTTASFGAGGMLIDADGDTTVKSLATAASASPIGIYNDSDAPGADKEVAADVAAYVDGADGAENGTRDLAVMEAGTRTVYIQLDGKNVQVEINKPLIVSGTIQGKAKFYSYDAAQTLTEAVHNSSLVQMTTADEVTMWDCETANVGDFVTLWARDAEKIEAVPASGDHFNLFAGTALTADYELDMAATAGTKVTLMCTADDTWSVYHETAASADGGAAD